LSTVFKHARDGILSGEGADAEDFVVRLHLFDRACLSVLDLDQTLLGVLGADDDLCGNADQVRVLETQKARMLEEGEDRAKLRYTELEREIEEKTVEFEDTLREMQQKSEEQLA
jgi:hypothetical protein